MVFGPAILEPHREQNQDINPEAVHEMPVDGSRIYCNSLVELPCKCPAVEDQVTERRDPSEQMQPVRGGKEIKEGAARVRGDIDAASCQFLPSQQLPGDKAKPQDQSAIQPEGELDTVIGSE